MHKNTEMHKLFWTKLCASQMCNSWTRTWVPVTTRWNTATNPKEFTTFIIIMFSLECYLHVLAPANITNENEMTSNFLDS